MPRIFIISSHGSMPVVDEEFKLPEFPSFHKNLVVKKTITKKPVGKKTGVDASIKPPATLKAKTPSATLKAKTPPATLKAKAPSATLKPPSAAKPPSALLFDIFKPAALFDAKASSAALFEAKTPSAALKLTSPSPSPSAASASAAAVAKAPFALGEKMKIKKPVSFITPVDVFTTTKCGHPFCADLKCDPPYVDLVHILSEHPISHDATKDEVRKLIKDTMVDIRSKPRHAKALTKTENKIRCHKKGSQMTELFLFGSSFEVPIIESVSMVDMETGRVQDVHKMFGLVKKPVVRLSSTHAKPSDELKREGLEARATAVVELKALEESGANPFYRDMKKEQIETIDATAAVQLKESKFEYSPEFKEKYGDLVKLSDLLQIGISNGMNSENDFVAVYACRVPDKGAEFPITSPRGYKSDGSVGGWSKTYKAKTKTKKSRRKTHKRLHLCNR